jgi:hypothetical protein
VAQYCLFRGVASQTTSQKVSIRERIRDETTR